MIKQNKIKKLLIDGDIVCYRACCGPDSWSDPEVGINSVLDTLSNVFEETTVYDHEIYFSGENNFRKKIYPEYKANRRNMERPPSLLLVKQHFIHYADQVADELEADDLLGLNQTEDTCIVSIDKDMLTIPGWHYNFVKKEYTYISPYFSRYLFYTQLLTGDPSDNVKGAKGIGAKKAEKILGDLTEENEMVLACLDYFGSYEEMKLNADCLWIQRAERLTWEEGVKDALQGQAPWED
jgi:DNA polymerase-1